MITISELWRRLQNMVVTAKVVKTMASEGKLLVQVLYTDKETGEEHLSRFLPMMSKNNSFVKVWFPPMPEEQVTVLRPFGDNDGGVVIPSIYWRGNKEPAGANEHTAIVEFYDGMVVKYDSETKELTAGSCEKIKFVCTAFEVLGDSTFNGNVDITEALDVSGDADFGGSVNNNGVDIGDTHTHEGNLGFPTGTPE